MADPKFYSRQFYQAQVEGSLRSAKIVVPILCEVLRPSSVIDVGCGCGAWLAVFRELGVGRVFGLDGDYVPRSSLLVSRDCFRAVDLNRPVLLEEKFDLALCLEVAEHLPRKCAPGLVGSLVKLAPVVVFSAAVPLQGGTNHVNEQWPEYWAALFGRYRYARIDAIRQAIWKDRDVDWWYRQNIFLFVQEDRVDSYPELAKARGGADDLMLVRAGVLRDHLWLRRTLKSLPGRILGAVKERLSGNKGAP